MFAQDGGSGAAEHIPQHSAAYTGGESQEDTEEGVVAEAGVDGVLHADDRKDSKARGVKDIQNGIIDKLHGLSPALLDVRDHKYHQGGQYGEEQINIIEECLGRNLSQEDIPNDAASDGGDGA